MVYLVFVKHVFTTFSSCQILSCEIIILAFLEIVGNTCLTRTRRDIGSSGIQCRIRKRHHVSRLTWNKDRPDNIFFVTELNEWNWDQYISIETILSIKLANLHSYLRAKTLYKAIKLLTLDRGDNFIERDAITILFLDSFTILLNRIAFRTRKGDTTKSDWGFVRGQATPAHSTSQSFILHSASLLTFEHFSLKVGRYCIFKWQFQIQPTISTETHFEENININRFSQVRRRELFLHFFISFWVSLLF